jgi:hypothetical protein
VKCKVVIIRFYLPNLREAMEAAHNYENSAQSLRKAVRRSKKKDKGKGKKDDRKDRRRRKYSDSDSNSESSDLEDSDSASSGSEEERSLHHHVGHTDPKEQEKRR